MIGTTEYTDTARPVPNTDYTKMYLTHLGGIILASEMESSITTSIAALHLDLLDMVLVV